MARMPALALTVLLGLVCFEGAPAGADGIGDRLPGRGAAGGFDFELTVRQAGRKTADLRVSAQPELGDAGPGGRVPTWKTAERLVFVDEASGIAVTEARLDETLFVLSGRYERKNAQGFLRAAFERDAKTGRYVFQHTTPEYENEIEAGEGKPGRGTLAGLLLLARMMPLERGLWRFFDVDPDPAAGDGYVVGAMLQSFGQMDWRQDDKTVPAWVFAYTRGHRTYRFALSAERAFLGLEVPGLDLEVTPQGVKTIGPADPTLVATPHELALRRAREIRATLPPPKAAFAYDGDLLLGEYLVGRFRLRAEPASVDGEPAWLVSETTVREAGEARVVSEWTGFLAQDLSLIRGESIHRAPSGARRSVYYRAGSSMVTRHTYGDQTTEPIVTPVRDGATTGLFAVIRFLGAVPSEKARYVLPGFDPRFLQAPKAGRGSLPVDLADATIDAQGGASFRDEESHIGYVSVRSGRKYTVVLSPSRELRTVVGGVPKLTVAPKGTGGKRVDFYDHVEGPSPTPYAAMIKFGRGYHLPRRDLLEQSFDWHSMRAAEIHAGSFPAGTSIDVIKKAWIDEFVARSKHRTVGDCDDLLFQILMTSDEGIDSEGGVTISTRPEYGGHHYRFMRLPDRGWVIVGVD